MSGELATDHFHPSFKGGAEDSSNWVYCCHACKEIKGNYWQPDSPKRILNPIADNLAEHFEEGSGRTDLSEICEQILRERFRDREPII